MVRDGIHGAVLDDREVGLEVRVGGVELHQQGRGVLLGLAQGHELGVPSGPGHVPEGPLDGVKVVGAHTGQDPLTRQILMELILEVDEVVLTRPDNVWPHTEDAMVQDQLLRLGGWVLGILGGLQLAWNTSRDRTMPS